MKLFQPLTIRGNTLKNRIVMAPMRTHFNIITQKARHYYQKRAAGNVGLIIIESVSVDQFIDPAFTKQIALLADIIHESGARVIVQLAIHPEIPNSNELIAPYGHKNMRQASLADIKNCYQRMGQAALACQSAGFDGIEIHGAHGYFMSQFFSPRFNKRTDDYGGNLTKRMRFAIECSLNVRQLVKDHFILSYRMSADEMIPGGADPIQSAQLAAELEAVGIDLIHVSAGVAGTGQFEVTPGADQPYGVYADLAQTIKQSVTIPVISVGRIHTAQAAGTILNENKADLIAVGRALLADPYLAIKMAREHTEKIVACLSCNHCIKTISKGLPVTCSVNPRLGKE